MGDPVSRHDSAAREATVPATTDLAIRVRGLGKQYKIGGRKAGYDTLRDRLADAISGPVRRATSLLRGQATGAAELHEVIWALRDVSFDVVRGEVVGIIGPNGAGKSTLLKVLSRITEPSEGYVELRGRVGSLLEVGTGFHPELTGRENIYLNGAILGMSKEVIERKFDDIVDFAGVEKFVETPVKHYSSGMYLRLAFAVAAHLEPEILLVDEVLAVGDAQFQRKCLGKMGEVAQAGRTVLFVSHNMAAVTQLCERVIWVDDGGIHMSGEPHDVISSYLASGASSTGRRVWEGGLARAGVEDFRIDEVRVRNARGQCTGELSFNDAFEIEIEYRVLQELPVSRVGLILSTADGVAVFDSFDSDDERYARPRQPGTYVSACTIPGRLLSPGRYFLSIVAGIPRDRNLASENAALTIDIADDGSVGSHFRVRRAGILQPELQWTQRYTSPIGRGAVDVESC